VKRLFIALFALLCALSVVAWEIRPRPSRDGRPAIVWVCDDNPARREQIALFERTHPGSRLALDPNTIGMEKAVVQCLAGVGPDVIVAYDGTQLATYARSGIAWDITDRLTSAGVNVRAGFWSGPEPTYLHDGRVYGLPTNAAADAIWLHKDLFEQQGVPLPTGPWKWDEFIGVAKRMTLRRADGSVEHFGFMLDWGTWQHFVMQWGGRLFNESGTVCTADSPEVIAATEFMSDLVYRHRVSPTPVEEAAMASRGGWGSAVMTQFAAKKGAMAMGGRWWLCLLRGCKGLSLGAVEAPHQARRVHRGYGKSLVINSMSPRREKALEFVLFMAARDYNELINHQADALGPVREFAYAEAYLHDPDFPEEDYNEVWRTALEHAQPESFSPFVNGYTVARIQSRQLDLVKNCAKTPAEAMRAVAREVNAEIARTVAKDPVLRAKYEDAVRGGGK
jgi:multiple sugar transport system substrate-binding protein